MNLAVSLTNALRLLASLLSSKVKISSKLHVRVDFFETERFQRKKLKEGFRQILFAYLNVFEISC